MSASPAVVAAVEAEMRAWGEPGGEHYPDPRLADEYRADMARDIAAAAEAEALEAAADTWRGGAWGDTPRKADRVADRIAAANFVTAWLRARAEEVRRA